MTSTIYNREWRRRHPDAVAEYARRQAAKRNRPLSMSSVTAAKDRFWARVDQSGDCWEWTGFLPQGYGRFVVDGHNIYAHRVSWFYASGSLPADGLEIDHLCRNRACVNPAHLEVVTPRENQRRSYSATGKNARKTHCLRGHPFAGRNLITRANGERGCRTCKLDWQRADRAARRVTA